MTRNLILGTCVALALACSPFTPRASADWQAYYDLVAKLESGPEKMRDSQQDIIDKLRSGYEKRAENYLDSIERVRAAQAAWLYRNSYPGYYLQPYYYGTMPTYSYPGYSRSYSPSSTRY